MSACVDPPSLVYATSGELCVSWVSSLGAQCSTLHMGDRSWDGTETHCMAAGESTVCLITKLDPGTAYQLHVLSGAQSSNVVEFRTLGAADNKTSDRAVNVTAEEQRMYDSYLESWQSSGTSNNASVQLSIHEFVEVLGELDLPPASTCNVGLTSWVTEDSYEPEKILLTWAFTHWVCGRGALRREALKREHHLAGELEQVKAELAAAQQREQGEDVEKLKVELLGLTTMKEKCEADLAEKVQEAENLSSELSTVRAALTQVNEGSSAAVSEAESVKMELEQTSAKLTAAEIETQNFRSEAAVLKAEVQALREANEESTLEVQALKEHQKKLTTSLNQQNIQLKEAQEAFLTEKRRFKESEAKAAGSASEANRYKAEITEVQALKQKCDAELSTLKRQSEKQSESGQATEVCPGSTFQMPGSLEEAIQWCDLAAAKLREAKQWQHWCEIARSGLQHRHQLNHKHKVISSQESVPEKAEMVGGRCSVCTLKPPCKHFQDSSAGDAKLAKLAKEIPVAEWHDQARLKFKLGKSLRSQCDDDGAVELFRLAALLDPTFKEPHCHMGAVLLTQEDARGALIAFETAIAMDPLYKDAHLYRACALADMIEVDQALCQFDLVLNLDEANFKAHYHLARMLHTLGKVDKATQEYRRVVELNNKHKETHFHLGRILELTEGTEAALPHLEEAVHLSPADGEFNHVLGLALHKLGRHDQALDCFKAAADNSPDEFEIQRTYGKALEGTGDPSLLDLAREQYEAALEINPNSALMHFELGHLVAKLGDNAKAARELTRAKQLDPSYDDEATVQCQNKTLPHLSKPIGQWTTGEVQQWFEKFSFASLYRETLDKLCIDGRTLEAMEESDLAVDLGMEANIHQRLLLSEIRALQAGHCMIPQSIVAHSGATAKGHLGKPELVTLFSYHVATRSWQTEDLLCRIAKVGFSKGAMRAAHRMEVVHAVGPSKQKVAKMYFKEGDDARESEAVYRRDVQIQEVARTYADAYNQLVPPKQVTFMSAQYGLRRECDNMPIAIETYLPGDYVKFNSNNDFAIRDVDDHYHQTPQAFSHFSWEHSGRREIVIDVQGVGEYYTDPQIHTVTGEGYGEGNLGCDGISAFFTKHKCNSICKYLGLQERELDQCRLLQNRMASFSH